MLAFFRAIKFSFQDIYRNFSLSFMTVLILILMLLSVNTLITIRFLTEAAATSIKNQIDVSVFFSHTATDEQVVEIQSFIKSFPEVTSIDYYNKDEVLTQFREQYASNAEVIASLEELGENPLGPTMVVKTREPNDYQKIITALSVPEYEGVISSKTFADTEVVIERVHTITEQIEKFGIGLTALFAIIAFFIIFNTIRVSIYTQRREISIKKLVGATNWFIRSPYIIESFVFAIISTAIAYGAVIALANLLDPYVALVFGQERLLTEYFLSNIILLAGIEFGAVLALTIFSSTLAMSRHLRV